MALNNYEQFTGVTEFGNDGYNENLLYGIEAWCRWSALQIGAFQNVEVAQSGYIGGGHPSKLYLATTPEQSKQAWESRRSDWVWETGVQHSVTPIVASGVTVDNTFYETSSTTGEFAHYIDYKQGRVVFDSPIDVTSDVNVAYAHRTIFFTRSKTPDFTQLLYDSMDVSKEEAHSRIAKTRVQLPAVGFEVVQRHESRPYELGNNVQWVQQDVLAYIMAEDEGTLNNIADIFSKQEDKVIYLINRNTMKADSGFPHDLDYRGMTVSNPLIYPDLLLSFAWGRVSMSNIRIQYMQNVNTWLHKAVVRITFTAII